MDDMDPHEAFSMSDFNAPPARAPRKIALFLPIGLFIASFAVPACILLAAIFDSDHPSMQLLAPGSAEFTMSEPGTMAILLETRTTYQGQTYFASDVPAGTIIRVTAKSDDSDIPVSLGSSYSESVGSTRRIGVGRCEIPRAGTYVVTIVGPMAPHVFLVRQSLLETLVPSIVLAVVIALAGIITSVSWLSVMVRRFARARQHASAVNAQMSRPEVPLPEEHSRL